ncbi:TPA: hypothetical protein ACPSKB_002635 [Legionella feeleii]|uniref:Uncharacterized protein n=1 Tax=Legionella feeleii TaxID=453 RepID=A0A378IUL2_9GAMM|nr:hypothetical protein [Legionella feeleii]STX38918.1 Uncharacterised protein [Legionella feeleii]
MTNFFKNRAPVQLAGDVAIGALGNARKGLFGTLLLSAAENSIPDPLPPWLGPVPLEEPS